MSAGQADDRERLLPADDQVPSAQAAPQESVAFLNAGTQAQVDEELELGVVRVHGAVENPVPQVVETSAGDVAPAAHVLAVNGGLQRPVFSEEEFAQ
jgi:hypothetical protein